MDSKICSVCLTPIFRRRREADRDWNSRRFCSLPCAYIGRRTNTGRKWSDETRAKMSRAKKGLRLWLGRKHSLEARLKMSVAKKGRRPRLGKRHSEHTKRKISQTKKLNGCHRLNRNSNWRGGASFEPYTTDFTRELKDQIKSRDNNMCQECGSSTDLCVHHIDYNKLNSVESNLITLCRSCHSKTNFTREQWIGYLKSKLTVATKLTFQLETTEP